MTFSAKKVAKMGIFIALPIVLKIPIFSIPNVEFFTFVVFAAGFLFGIIEGGIVGALSMGIYTSFNPYGLPPLPIGLAQIISMALVGISGGIFFWFKLLKRITFSTFIWMGLAGFLLTLLYDFLTNSGVALAMGEFIPIMVAAIPFTLIHLLSNLFIFIILTPVLFRLAKLERGEKFA